MRVTPKDRIDFGRSLADTRLDSRRGYLLIPTFARSGFDVDTQSANDVSSGDGTGQTATWKIYPFHANLRNIDQALQAFGRVPPGIELGDSFFSIGLRDETIFRQGYQEEHAYIYLDKETYRVIALTGAGVGQIEEWIVGVKKFNPVHRATGY